MLRRLPLEALGWFTALMVLAFADPMNGHVSLCPFRNAGIDFCPGCGLGRSISLFLQGEVGASLRMHPLGIFAVIILSYRTINLITRYLRNYGKNY